MLPLHQRPVATARPARAIRNRTWSLVQPASPASCPGDKHNRRPNHERVMTGPVALASGLASLVSIAAGAAALLWRQAHGNVQLLRLHLGEQLKVVDASSIEQRAGPPFIGGT